MATHFHIHRPFENEDFLNPQGLKLYQSGTGTLLYLIKHSRPDIANAVRELSKAMDRSNIENLQAMYKLIKYVVHTRNYGVKITLNKTEDIFPLRLTCFTDSDWAGDADTRKSISGWIIFIQDNPICWGSRQQRITAGSSTEAEYIGISDICKELLFLIHIIEFLKVKVDMPVKIYVDNKGAIFIAENPVVKRTKHIDTRFHIIREHIENDIVKIQFITSVENTADIFTKNTTEETHNKHRDKIIAQFTD